MAPKPDTALLDIHQQPPPARDALVDVTLTSSNPATAANTKPLQKKALERGEKAYRAWKQRQAERAGARPAPQAAAPALAGPPAPPASAPYHAPPHSAPGARLPAPLPSQPSVTEICVEVGSAPSSPRRPMGPAAALANATAAAMPIATELFSRLGQLACPPPPTHHRQHEEAPLVDDANTLGDMPSHNALPHTQQQESWHWSMRLPIWYVQIVGSREAFICCCRRLHPTPRPSPIQQQQAIHIYVGCGVGRRRCRGAHHHLLPPKPNHGDAHAHRRQHQPCMAT